MVWSLERKVEWVVLEKVGEVVANGDLVAPYSKEVSCSSGEQGGEAHAEVSLSGELVDWSSSNGGPNEGV